MGDILNSKPKPTAIEIALVEARFLTRWPCTVCGGCTDKVPILAEGEQALSNDGEFRTVRVCENCLQFGEIDARLEQHALMLETEARLLREMIGRLQVPTFAEWQARCEQHEREYMEDYEKATDKLIDEIEAEDDLGASQRR